MRGCDFTAVYLTRANGGLAQMLGVLQIPNHLTPARPRANSKVWTSSLQKNKSGRMVNIFLTICHEHVMLCICFKVKVILSYENSGSSETEKVQSKSFRAQPSFLYVFMSRAEKLSANTLQIK